MQQQQQTTPPQKVVSPAPATGAGINLVDDVDKNGNPINGSTTIIAPLPRSETELLSNLQNKKKPGCYDNHDRCALYPLKKDLKEKEFEVVHEKVWKKFAELYDFDYCIRRRAIPSTSHDQNVHVLLQENQVVLRTEDVSSVAKSEKEEAAADAKKAEEVQKPTASAMDGLVTGPNHADETTATAVMPQPNFGMPPPAHGMLNYGQAAVSQSLFGNDPPPPIVHNSSPRGTIGMTNRFASGTVTKNNPNHPELELHGYSLPVYHVKFNKNETREDNWKPQSNIPDFFYLESRLASAEAVKRRLGKIIGVEVVDETGEVGVEEQITSTLAATPSNENSSVKMEVDEELDNKVNNDHGNNKQPLPTVSEGIEPAAEPSLQLPVQLSSTSADDNSTGAQMNNPPELPIVSAAVATSTELQGGGHLAVVAAGAAPAGGTSCASAVDLQGEGHDAQIGGVEQSTSAVETTSSQQINVNMLQTPSPMVGPQMLPRRPDDTESEPQSSCSALLQPLEEEQQQEGVVKPDSAAAGAAPPSGPPALKITLLPANHGGCVDSLNEMEMAPPAAGVVVPAQDCSYGQELREDQKQQGSASISAGPAARPATSDATNTTQAGATSGAGLGTRTASPFDQQNLLRKRQLKLIDYFSKNKTKDCLTKPDKMNNNSVVQNNQVGDANKNNSKEQSTKNFGWHKSLQQLTIYDNNPVLVEEADEAGEFPPAADSSQQMNAGQSFFNGMNAASSSCSNNTNTYNTSGSMGFGINNNNTSSSSSSTYGGFHNWNNTTTGNNNSSFWNAQREDQATQGEKKPGQPVGAVGLANLGNTCYMNSSLQCLAALPLLRDYFVQGLFKNQLNETAWKSEGKTATCFAGLLQLMNQAENVKVAPKGFKAEVGRVNDQFCGFGQHDAMEFLEAIVDSLKEDTSTVRGKKPYAEFPDDDVRPEQEILDATLDINRRRCNSFLDEMLFGVERSKVRCPKCDKVSVTFSNVLATSLQMVARDKTSFVTFTVNVVRRKVESSSSSSCTTGGGSTSSSSRGKSVRNNGAPQEDDGLEDFPDLPLDSGDIGVSSSAGGQHPPLDDHWELVAPTSEPFPAMRDPNDLFDPMPPLLPEDQLFQQQQQEPSPYTALPPPGGYSCNDLWASPEPLPDLIPLENSTSNHDANINTAGVPSCPSSSQPPVAPISPNLLQITVDIEKQGSVADLVKKIKETHPNIAEHWSLEKNLLVVEVDNGRPKKYYEPRDCVDSIGSTDVLYIYEVLDKTHFSEDVLHSPVLLGGSSPLTPPKQQEMGILNSAGTTTNGGSSSAAAGGAAEQPAAGEQASAIGPQLPPGGGQLVQPAAPAGPPVVVKTLRAEMAKWSDFDSDEDDDDAAKKQAASKESGKMTASSSPTSDNVEMPDQNSTALSMNQIPQINPAQEDVKMKTDSPNDKEQFYLGPSTFVEQEPASSRVQNGIVLILENQTKIPPLIFSAPADITCGDFFQLARQKATEHFMQQNETGTGGVGFSTSSSSSSRSTSTSSQLPANFQLPPFKLFKATSAAKPSRIGSFLARNFQRQNDGSKEIFEFREDNGKINDQRVFAETENPGKKYMRVEIAEFFWNKLGQLPSPRQISSEKKRKLDGNLRLHQLLDLYTEEEQLGEDDFWRCPRCDERVAGYKKLDFYRLPPVFVVHLKRFQFNRWCRERIDTPVDYPARMDLNDLVIDSESSVDYTYELTGVVKHIGVADGGHYVAFAKHSDKWFEFNDSWVTEHSEEQVLNQNTGAYVLFYQRKSILEDYREQEKMHQKMLNFKLAAEVEKNNSSTTPKVDVLAGGVVTTSPSEKENRNATPQAAGDGGSSGAVIDKMNPPGEQALGRCNSSGLTQILASTRISEGGNEDAEEAGGGQEIKASTTTGPGPLRGLSPPMKVPPLTLNGVVDRQQPENKNSSTPQTVDINAANTSSCSTASPTQALAAMPPIFQQLLANVVKRSAENNSTTCGDATSGANTTTTKEDGSDAEGVSTTGSCRSQQEQPGAGAAGGSGTNGATSSSSSASSSCSAAA
ncbi:unnamed protein product [Amoebophrya sp. A120]|nr:unnamed protein product [Amoebophrya sp. A120]|eukprot:GSA120T00024589001.1